MEEQSFALDLLRDYKKQNKRQFIIILIILVMWFCTIGYLVYILNDIGTVETTTTVQQSDEAFHFMAESLKDFTKYLFETAETPQQKQMLKEALQSSMM